MTIYVVEIPHQMPPIAWAAEDEAELIAKVNAYTSEEISEYEAAVDAIQRDLHTALIFTSEAEAREALAADENWELHQGWRAREALRDLLG